MDISETKEEMEKKSEISDISSQGICLVFMHCITEIIVLNILFYIWKHYDIDLFVNGTKFIKI